MKTTERVWISLGKVDGKEIKIPITEEEPEISDIMCDYFRFRRKLHVLLAIACVLIVFIGGIYYF